MNELIKLFISNKIDYFMRTDEITEHYNIVHHKKEIEQICDKIKQIGFNNFRTTIHFEKRVSGFIRGFDRNIVFETLPKLDNVKVINIRKLKKGDLAHDIYYELNETQTLIITLCLETKEIINSVLKFSRYKNFIRNYYK